MSDDIYISYTDNGFLHSFSAAKDAHDEWHIQFLVMHAKDRSKVYLGEYTKFRTQVISRLYALSLADKRAILAKINDVYVKVIQSFLSRYIARIHVNCPKDASLYDYGQKQISKLQKVTDAFDIDLRITRIYQPCRVAFHFTWDGDIVASYYINQRSNTDYLDTTMR